MRRVGELLVERGLVSQSDLDQALAATQGEAVGPALVRLGALSEADLIDALADALALPVLHPSALPSADAVAAAAARLRAPMPWLRDRGVAPWFDEAGVLHVAGRVHDPAVQEAAAQWGEARLMLAPADMLQPLFDGGAPGETTTDAARLRELAEGAPVIDFVTAMLAEAVARRASDIHIEPFEDNMVVRLRVDGLLVDWRTAPRALYEAVASRLKLLSGMDIAERRRPQDGRQSIRVSGQEQDLRVATLPTTWGEALVLRFLGRTRTLPTFEGLGLAPDHLAQMRRLLGRGNGIVLVTGPTGSGKTTTVYRMLMELNNGARKIVTVEDPVEIDLPRAIQMQVRSDIGLGFAEGLRSILRHDPEVIMVGEIRDAETARIAVQAALTGHLVISTLHTNSALAAVARLIDLGVEPFLLADVLRGIVGQRLIRRTCARCKGAGCAACAGEGVVGRIGVFEVAEVDGALHDAIRARLGEAALEALVRANGFRSIREDAELKARAGETTPAEAARAAG